MSLLTTPALRPAEALDTLSIDPRADVPGESATISGALLEKLALALDQQQIGYCQWKGHWSAHRWSRGYGDVDLLVDRASLPAFRLLAGQLGFKLAYPAGARQIPGIEHYLGFDASISRLLHLHVHYSLLLGEYWERVYRIPIECQVLEQSCPGHPFRIPSPTHRFLIFVLRMMLRQVGRPLLSAHGRWLSGIDVPLGSLEAASDPEELEHLLTQLHPLDSSFFQRCLRSLQRKSGTIERLLLPWKLHRRLRAYVRRPTFPALITATVERLLPAAVVRRLTDPRMRLSAGGLAMALINTNGQKSSHSRELYSWLVPDLPTMRADLGNPPKSLLTLVTEGALQLQRRATQLLRRTQKEGGHLKVFRRVCTARDRYLLYKRVRRFAVSGGVAVCERYAAGKRIKAGGRSAGELPWQTGWLAQQLQKAEASYENAIVAPDALFVLNLDPAPGWARTPSQELSDSHRQLIGPSDGNTTPGYVVDATQPLPEVMQQLKTLVWSLL